MDDGLPDEPWVADAECSGLDRRLFLLPSLSQSASALRVCQRCTVRQECLDHALRNHVEVGVWGGMTARQRASYLAQRGDA